MTLRPAQSAPDAFQAHLAAKPTPDSLETLTGLLRDPHELPEAQLRRRIGTSAEFVDRGHNTAGHTAAALRDIVTHLASLEQGIEDLQQAIRQLEQRLDQTKDDGR